MTSFNAEQRPVIQVRDLTIGFDNLPILENINFDVYPGEIFVILGGSGCGKSTLLKHLIGLQEPISGQISINGTDLTSGAGSKLQKVLRQCGILFQGGALFSSMSVAENVALPLREYSGLPDENIDILVRMKLKLVQLSGFENHLPAELSGGMKKRVGLARAMALNPAILFCDEPSAGLDPITSAEMDRMLLDINNNLGTTMIIVTHELSSIFNIADRVIMLDKNIKGVVAEGDPHYLRDHSLNSYVQRFFTRKPEPL
jgi:phospholipid/cholesterol/gamma-HCH transport system ATP-binding protein